MFHLDRGAYLSNDKIIAAWMRATIVNAQVHNDDGVYIFEDPAALPAVAAVKPSR